MGELIQLFEKENDTTKVIKKGTVIKVLLEDCKYDKAHYITKKPYLARLKRDLILDNRHYKNIKFLIEKIEKDEEEILYTEIETPFFTMIFEVDNSTVITNIINNIQKVEEKTYKIDTDTIIYYIRIES